MTDNRGQTCSFFNRQVNRVIADGSNQLFVRGSMDYRNRYAATTFRKDKDMRVTAIYGRAERVQHYASVFRRDKSF